jgi:hypothetical protein
MTGDASAAASTFANHLLLCEVGITRRSARLLAAPTYQLVSLATKSSSAA